MATLFARYRTWGSRHPWQQLALSFVVLTILAVLIPPRDSLVVAVVKVAAIFALVYAMNLALYRSLLPTRERIQQENDRYASIDRAIREGRSDVAHLEGIQGTGGPGPII